MVPACGIDQAGRGRIVGLFASAALVLAVVGVYNPVAYGVTPRTREIGIDLALGATPSRIVMIGVRPPHGRSARLWLSTKPRENRSPAGVGMQGFERRVEPVFRHARFVIIHCFVQPHER